MVTDVAVFAFFLGGYCRCVQCVNGKVGVDHVVGSPVSQHSQCWFPDMISRDSGRN